MNTLLVTRILDTMHDPLLSLLRQLLLPKVTNIMQWTIKVISCECLAIQKDTVTMIFTMISFNLTLLLPCVYSLVLLQITPLFTH